MNRWLRIGEAAQQSVYEGVCIFGGVYMCGSLQDECKLNEYGLVNRELN